MNVVRVPHPTLVGIGLSLGVTAVIAAGIVAFADASHLAHAYLATGYVPGGGAAGSNVPAPGGWPPGGWGHPLFGGPCWNHLFTGC